MLSLRPVLLPALLLLAACAPAVKDSGTAAAAKAVPLENTQWRVEAVGSLHAEPAAQLPSWIQISGSSVEGNTGCNSLKGSAQMDGAALSFGPIGTTKRFCPDTSAIENAMLSALNEVQQWTIKGDVLELLDAQGATVISLRASATPITP